MNIEISDETYKFIKNLTDEIETQSNRCTAAPYAYVINEEYEDVAVDGNGEAKYYHSDYEGLHDYSDVKEEFGEYLKEHPHTDHTEFDFNDYLYQEGIDTIWVEKNTRISEYHTNFFLTEKAVKKHIEQNSYHFKKPQDYVIHLWRNPEMKLVLKSLFEIVGKKEFKK